MPQQPRDDRIADAFATMVGLLMLTSALCVPVIGFGPVLILSAAAFATAAIAKVVLPRD